GARSGELRAQGSDRKKALRPLEKREAAHFLVAEHGLSRSRACAALQLSRSSWYRAATGGRGGYFVISPDLPCSAPYRLPYVLRPGVSVTGLRRLVPEQRRCAQLHPAGKTQSECLHR